MTLTLSGCDLGADPEASPLEDLQLVGVDFELNSIVISNDSEQEVRTRGLWAYRDGQSFQFDIFIVEPRATILFSMRDLGDISTTGGEIAPTGSDDFSDPETMLQYVAWGEADFQLSGTATEAGLWPPSGETVPVSDDSLILLRVDPSGNGPTAWQASDEID